MKYRESGMPEENLLNTFFDPDQVLRLMEVNEKINVLIDIGCGYGTFLIPASKIIKEKVIGTDVDNEMIIICKNKIYQNNIQNAELQNIDISSDNLEIFKKYKGKIDYISLFNILHCENPVELLKRIYRILNKNGKIGVIHWKYEKTPRGPSMDIRPKPEQIIEWANSAGFKLDKQVDLKPFHFGLVFIK